MLNILFSALIFFQQELCAYRLEEISFIKDKIRGTNYFN